MKKEMDPRLAAFERLLTVMDDLRTQCPWDQKQTLETLRPLTIEETYELADAITEGNKHEIAKEIGDLFLHLVFYCKIGSEQGAVKKDFSQSAIKLLQAYDWTGNIRELRNVVERLIILGEQEISESDVKLFASK